MSQNDDMRELAQRGFRYAFSLTHDRAHAEDLLQDAWISTLKNVDTPKRAYLFSAIRSRFVDKYRRAQLLVFESLDEKPEAAKHDAPNDEEVLANEQLVEQALKVLRPVEREVLLLSDVEGYTAREITELTGYPRGSVLSLIHRSRRRLRQYLVMLGEDMHNAESATK